MANRLLNDHDFNHFVFIFEFDHAVKIRVSTQKRSELTSKEKKNKNKKRKIESCISTIPPNYALRYKRINIFGFGLN